MTANDFFFCYDKDTAKYLRYDKGIQFITTAIHEKTRQKFWMFERTTELTKALSEK